MSTISEKNTAVLRLFKGYIPLSGYADKGYLDKINTAALKKGVVISAAAPTTVVSAAQKMYGKDGKEWNQTLHKSFDTVANASFETLLLQQLMHYYTTYGFEQLGIYNSDLVYIPHEELDIPELKDDVALTVIKELSEDQIKEKMMVLLTSGIALSEETINDVGVLSDYINPDEIESISNREAKNILYKKFNRVPTQPEEFLRYVIYDVTGDTLKIQSPKMLRSIKASNHTQALYDFNTYINQDPQGSEHALAQLSSIFLRNKNLFLAFKGVSKPKLNHIINVLRRLAPQHHQPLAPDFLNNLTSLYIVNEARFNKSLNKTLDSVTIFREVRILNALNYYASAPQSAVYRIRNGHTHVKSLENRHDHSSDCATAAAMVRAHLAGRLSTVLKDKTILIPESVEYMAPTSEKQFVGNVPEGSFVSTPAGKDMVFGIHWVNLPAGRVDLDLHITGTNDYGWDADWRSASREVLFSGDVTDAPAPNGATELFLIAPSAATGTNEAEVYFYNADYLSSEKPVCPFELIIASDEGAVERVKKECPDRHAHRYTYAVDPNKIIAKVNLKVDRESKTIGSLVFDENQSPRFVFKNSIGTKARTIDKNEDKSLRLKACELQAATQLRLRDLLTAAGAHVISEVTVNEKVDVDLSIDVLTKETLIKLLTPAKEEQKEQNIDID